MILDGATYWARSEGRSLGKRCKHCGNLIVSKHGCSFCKNTRRALLDSVRGQLREVRK